MVDTVVVQTPETTGEAPAEHNQKMIDKANGITPPATDEAPTEDRPEWLPEKFKSPEDMAKAYAALEGKLGAPAEAAADVPVITDEDDKAVEAALTKSGMSLTEFSKEYNDTGALSSESYSKLLDAGYDKELVDSYISGQQARAALYVTELKEVAGGSSAYESMILWAKASMTSAEITSYNESMASPNRETAKLAIAGLKARYESANGRTPSFVRGQSAATGSDQYESRSEITAAMKDPRYAKDAAYRAKVEAKLGRSKF